MKRSLVLLALLLTACDGGTTTPPPGTDGSVPPPSGSRSDPAAYVRGSYTSLVIELDVAPGLMPRSGVDAVVLDALGPLLDKPDGITIERDDEIPSERLRAEWTFDDVRALGDELFDSIGSGDQAVMHTMWLPGRYQTAGGGTVLGVAWSNQHIAMFPEAIESACSSFLPTVRERVCREAEAAVWTHEIGHVIGLVNNGIPMAMDHEDPEHEGHTSDPDGVMYWAYEGAAVGDLVMSRITGGDARTFEFGPGSLADVAAFRE